MPERRTKEQKIRAQQHRQAALQYSFTANTAKSMVAAGKKSDTTPSRSTTSSGLSAKTSTVTQPLSSAQSAQSIFSYDTNLIFADLQKTVLITIGILMMLGVTAVYVK